MDQTTVALGIGIGTILASGVTSTIVTYRLNRRKERFEFLRGKAETLYLAVDQFVKLLSIHALSYYPVLKGDIDWNQMLDLQIASGSKPGRHEGADVMEMLVALYFLSVRPALADLLKARDGFNAITHEMKRDYKQYGRIPADRHGQRFQQAVDLINAKGDILKKTTIAAARSTIGAKLIDNGLGARSPRGPA